MAAISSFKYHGFDYSWCSSSSTRIKKGAPVSSLPISRIPRPNLGSNAKPYAPFRLKSSCKRNKGLEGWAPVRIVSCSMEDRVESYPEESPSISETSQEVATVDLKLPRRSLLVAFTCNACGARSERLINRLAYERGLVYVQCSGCSQYHKLVDNLGLVIEYNLHEEMDLDARSDQV